MLENTNIKQFYPGPILNKTLDITDFLFKDPEQVHITYTYKNEDGSLNNRELAYGTEYEVAKILPSDVTQADAALTASTGRVTLKTDINVALGEKLTIYRESEIIQETQYPRTGPFPAASHEGALDYLTMQNQEQQDQINRALKVPISTANFDGALPIPVPARALKINNSGSGFELSEYDPDTALETTKEYMEGAQTAASSALASQNAAASSASSAANSEIVATQQANIATAKTAEVTETYNNAMADITTNKDQSMSAINENRISSIEEISNTKVTAISDITTAGTEQVANVQSTGFYMRDGKLYYVDANGETKEFKSGGSGLELCDIGMALYVDETKGLRRRLNGSIMDITSNYQAFLTRLKEITTLYPSLVCTESEWQTTKTMSKLGQCGKFVYNYGADGTTVTSIRLPLVININGLVDMANAGLIKDESLPNITATMNNDISQGEASGAISITRSYDGAMWYGATSIKRMRDWDFNASRSSSTYQDNAPVQQEAVQYPYFIQIATGSETEANIVNTLESVNGFTLLESKYSDKPLYNESWLLSNGQWNAKAVYPTAYEGLQVEYNTEIEAGTTVTLPSGVSYTKRGLSVKLSTETYTDYDFRLNTAEETFRLPLDTIDHPINSTGTLPVKGNGTPLTFTTDDINFANMSQYNNIYQVHNGNIPVNTPLKLISDPTKSGIVADLTSRKANLYLYFYVGDIDQNHGIVNMGRIGEQLANKIDYVQGARAGMPSKMYDDLTVLASGQTYTAPADGYFAFDCLATNSTCSILMVNQDTFYAVGSGYSNNSHMAIASSVPAKKGEKVSLEYRDCTPIYFRFIYAEGVAN